MWKTAVVGFGKIAHGYASDPLMAKHFQYATHAQVLKDHGQFNWVAAVDQSEDSLKQAREQWRVERVATTVDDLEGKEEIDVLVLATPPDARLGIISKFPNLKAVLVEKPLGSSQVEVDRFVDECRAANVIVQVNLLRRADDFVRRLANDALATYVGVPQAVFGLYGNGLFNNGMHMVDLARNLFGEVESVQAINGRHFAEGPIKGDMNVPFVLVFRSGLVANFAPVQFESYRENSLDIVGTAGVLSYRHGGITILKYGVQDARSQHGAREIAVDKPEVIESTLGTALYNMYTDLAAALEKGSSVISPLESALATYGVLNKVMRSFTASVTAASGL